MNEVDDNDDIGLSEPKDQNSIERDSSNQTFGNVGQGWDDVKMTDSFSIGSKLGNQRDRIVVLGRTRSGKTVFLSRLYAECWEGKSALRMACQSGPDHLNLMTQIAEMEKGKWPEATLGSRYYSIDITKDKYTIPMVILDYPGEVFRKAFVDDVDDENTQELLGHIDRAVAVLIIADPGVAIRGDTLEKVDDDYGIAKAIKRVRQAPNGHEIPISIVMTKCDIHAKKIMSIMEKEGMKKKDKWHKFLSKYYSSWFYELKSGGPYKIFPIAAVRTRKDARGSLIPDMSKPSHNLLKPVEWCFDKVRTVRVKVQKSQEMKEKAEKFAHFQNVEAKKIKKENKSLLLFWIIAILLLGGIAWGTYAISSWNGLSKQNGNDTNQPLDSLNNSQNAGK